MSEIIKLIIVWLKDFEWMIVSKSQGPLDKVSGTYLAICKKEKEKKDPFFVSLKLKDQKRFQYTMPKTAEPEDY